MQAKDSIRERQECVRPTSTALRRVMEICGTLGVLAVAACTDHVVGPTARTAVAERSAASVRAVPASIAWQKTSRDLALSRAASQQVATRGTGLLGLAQYAAIAAADGGDGDHEFEGEEGGWRAQRGAVAGASAAMLTYLFPLDAAAIEAQVRQQQIADGPPSNPQFARGEARGRDAAARLIARARIDGFGSPWTGTVPTGDPSTRPWRSSAAAPVLPTLGQMTPFLLTSGDQFRSDPPPAASSQKYIDDLAQVLAFSRLPSNDPERVRQIGIARKWATGLTIGYWGARASGLIETTGLGEREAAHVFALIGSASMDAVIGCWDAKYTYWLWRPVHAEPSIGLVITMPNHPSYPSGHSCQSAAVGEVLATIFPFAATALNEEVVEAGRSRVYGGIHFQFDCDAGQALGRSVARYTLAVDRDRGILEALR
jgi:PAP2 superfamily protein